MSLTYNPLSSVRPKPSITKVDPILNPAFLYNYLIRVASNARSSSDERHVIHGLVNMEASREGL